MSLIEIRIEGTITEWTILGFVIGCFLYGFIKRAIQTRKRP